MMKPRFKTLFTAAVCLGIMLQTSAVLPSVNGDYTEIIRSKYSASAPVLDGTVYEYKVEWKEAIRYIGLGQGFENLFLMHDKDYFYIGIWVFDDHGDAADAIAIFLDEGDDGSHGGGSGDGVLTDNQEDCKIIYGDGQLRDGYFEGGNWHFTADSAQINFEAAIRYYINHWEAEFKIPFKGAEGNPDDPSDLNIDEGDQIGILICLRDSDGSESSYPLLSNTLDPSTYSALKFDKYPPSVNDISYSPQKPQPGDAVTVSTTVTDQDSGVATVMLRYSTRSGATWYTVPMKAESGSIYTATIPEQPEGTTVQFRIEAEDKSTSVTTSAETSYTVETLIFGMNPTIFYTLIGVLAVVTMSFAGLVVLKSRKPKEKLSN